MKRLALPAAVMAASMAALPAAEAGDTPLTTERIVFGLNVPTVLTHAPGDYERLFVMGLNGDIRIVKNGELLPTPFIDIGTSYAVALVFDPDYQTNGYFYVNYLGIGLANRIVRYQVSSDPDIADPQSETIILKYGENIVQHKGGWLKFGPDGYLYAGTGNGNAAPTDPTAQDMQTLLGKILRLDVHNDDFPGDPDRNYAIPADNPFVGNRAVLPEIWASGVRHTWRASFDRETGDLWVSDVGGGAYEEINFLPAGSGGGQNYGWPCEEGAHCNTFSASQIEGVCECGDKSLFRPIYDYAHPEVDPRCVIGGYVYRGCAIPDLVGTYVFSDSSSRETFLLRHENGTVIDVENITVEIEPPAAPSIGVISSIGEDAYGELYIVDHYGGELFKIVPAISVGDDCNSNGVNDACETLDGSVADVNGNGVPDSCEGVTGDLNGDLLVNAADLAALLGAWSIPPGSPGCDGASHCAADLNDDGTVNAADLAILLGAWTL